MNIVSRLPDQASPNRRLRAGGHSTSRGADSARLTPRAGSEQWTSAQGWRGRLVARMASGEPGKVGNWCGAEESVAASRGMKRR